MANSKGVSSTLFLSFIFILVIILLFVFNFIILPPEFYSAFAGAAVAITFSGLLTYYFWQKQKRLSKDTKAQIIQTLLSEIELNMNNIANFIKGCKEGTHLIPFFTASMHKISFWNRFLVDYPHPSFELTQQFDLIYSSFMLMEYNAKRFQESLPKNMIFIPPSGVPLPDPMGKQIIDASFGHLQSWRDNVKAMIGCYDRIIKALRKEFEGYEFNKQLYFEDNNTYPKLKSFYTEM